MLPQADSVHLASSSSACGAFSVEGIHSISWVRQAGGYLHLIICSTCSGRVKSEDWFASHRWKAEMMPLLPSSFSSFKPMFGGWA